MDKEKIEAIRSQMTHYTAVKSVMAVPMRRGEYNILRGRETEEGGDPEDPGYLIENAHGDDPNVDGFKGHVSWVPKSQFSRYCQPSETVEQRLFMEINQLYIRMFLLRKYLRGENPESEEYSLINIQLKNMEAYHLTLLMRYEKMKK